MCFGLFEPGKAPGKQGAVAQDHHSILGKYHDGVFGGIQRLYIALYLFARGYGKQYGAVACKAV